MSANRSRKGIGGRPAKFAEPSSPCTVTLPHSTIRQLRDIDPDRSVAIVRAAALAMQARGSAGPPVEVVAVSRGSGLLIVGPSRALRRIPFLHLAEVAPARYLLALSAGHDSAGLELALRDLLEALPAAEADERPLLEQLLKQLNRLRRTQTPATGVMLVHPGPSAA